MEILKASVGELVVVVITVVVRVMEMEKEDMVMVVMGVMVVEQWRREGEEEGDEKWG